MSKSLWIAQRFLMNESGHYTVTGDCGAEKVLIEIDPSVVAGREQKAERHLMNMRAKILAAARRKWEAGEAYPVQHAYSGRVQHQTIALTAEDLRD